jgi:hypothetical protein
MLLALSLTGIAAGAALVADNLDAIVVEPAEPAEPAENATDTTLTFEDIDANGVDDDCQDVAAVAAPDALTAAELAEVDLDGDGTISVSEAAQSDRIGGKNCNHGGYVSGVAKGDEDAAEATEAEADETPSECEAPAEPEAPPAAEVPADTAPNAHGKAVSEVAQSDAVGGKNCNHGGAVSEAAKKDHSGQPDAAAKKAAGKAHGKSQGKGHAAND